MASSGAPSHHPKAHSDFSPAMMTVPREHRGRLPFPPTSSTLRPSPQPGCHSARLQCHVDVWELMPLGAASAMQQFWETVHGLLRRPAELTPFVRRSLLPQDMPCATSSFHASHSPPLTPAFCNHHLCQLAAPNPCLRLCSQGSQFS